MRGLGRYLATAASVGNGVAGVAAMAALALLGPESSWVPPLFAAGLLLDGLDGWLARRFGSIPSGATWDAGGDAVTYLALPSLVVYDPSPIAASLFFVAGLMRLKRFVRSPDAPSYRGLPASVAGTLLLLLSLAEPARMLAPGCALVLAALMHVPWAYPKLRGANAPWLTILAALVGIHALVFASVVSLRGLVLVSGLVAAAGILVAAPFIERKRQARVARAGVRSAGST